MNNNESKQLAVIEGTLSIAQIVKQRELIAQAMAAVMKEGQHYGTIPGCGPKPTLLQPGAQILSNIFRLRPEYEIGEKSLPGDNKTFTIKCRLFLIGSEPPISIGEGLGEASSMESKYRYRNAAAEIRETGVPLPGAYWKIKEGQGPEKAAEWLASAHDGRKVGPKKIGGQWMVVEYLGGEGKIENPNPTDVHNTVLKIAKKRAFVDATITATASSDFFTQDLEDIRANLDAVDVEAATAPAAKTEPTKPEAKKEKPAASQPEQPKGGDWRNVVCHFGKAGGPLKGKKLGEMEENRLQWIFETIGNKPEAGLSKEDRLLKAALAMWKAESSGEPAGAQTTAGPADEEARSANLNSLSTNLDYAGVDNDAFMSIARAKRWTKAEKFGEITAEEAASMVENCETVIEECQKAAKGAQ